MDAQARGTVVQVPPQELLQGAATHTEIVGEIPANDNQTTELEIPEGVNIVYSIFYQLICATASLGPLVGSEMGIVTVARTQTGALAGVDRSSLGAFGAPPCNMGASDTGDDVHINLLVTNTDLGNPADYKLILTITALQVSVDIAEGA